MNWGQVRAPPKLNPEFENSIYTTEAMVDFLREMYGVESRVYQEHFAEAGYLPAETFQFILLPAETPQIIWGKARECMEKAEAIYLSE